MFPRYSRKLHVSTMATGLGNSMPLPLAHFLSSFSTASSGPCTAKKRNHRHSIPCAPAPVDHLACMTALTRKFYQLKSELLVPFFRLEERSPKCPAWGSRQLCMLLHPAILRMHLHEITSQLLEQGSKDWQQQCQCIICDKISQHRWKLAYSSSQCSTGQPTYLNMSSCTIPLTTKDAATPNWRPNCERLPVTPVSVLTKRCSMIGSYICMPL